MNLQGKSNVGYPCSTKEDNTVHIKALIKNDKQHKLCNKAVELNLPKLIVYEILHKKLEYQKVSKAIN